MKIFRVILKLGFGLTTVELPSPGNLKIVPDHESKSSVKIFFLVKF